MDSPVINFALLLGVTGLPLATLFLLFFIGALFYKRARSFAARLIVQSVAVSIVAGLIMWAAVHSSLPRPYNSAATFTVTLFAFGAGGFVMFFIFLRKSKREAAKQLG